MSDLYFSKPVPAQPQPPKPVQPPPFYNAAAAMEFFRTAGKAESFAAGAKIFAEDDKGGGLFGKRDRMYLLLSGEVEMHTQGKPIGIVRVGEIFGEMAAIAQAARTATAVAKSACSLIGMDDKQFQSGLQQKPEFALMMMSVINSRLRSTISRLQASRTLHAGEAKEVEIFDKKMLAALVKALGGERATVRTPAGKTIMQEGTTGNVMYVVLEGRVTISIKAGVVGRAGAGGVFGEMALVDQSPRAASAMAETDCAFLAINREAFLHLVKTSPAFGAALLAGIAERAKEMAGRNK
ncbi:MAG: cyclic nucleotide-binding domain-containing protein [Betaproteobacteria bacterium]|nr:cyclic nucleotide-binding domain-containing protein [Betaproteobacteria bacterium]